MNDRLNNFLQNSTKVLARVMAYPVDHPWLIFIPAGENVLLPKAI